MDNVSDPVYRKNARAFLKCFLNTKCSFFYIFYNKSHVYSSFHTNFLSFVFVDTNKNRSETVLECKVENKTCIPRVQARSNSLRVMDCDICCSEHNFCRDCCCILCGRKIYDAYNLIRCEAIVDCNRNLICGHIAHLDCAIRAYLAGTIVGDSSDLDVEYYCRRCDNRSDLISHFTSLVHICESPLLPSQVDVEEVSNLILRALNGSEKIRAKDLRARIESVLAKVCT